MARLVLSVKNGDRVKVGDGWIKVQGTGEKTRLVFEFDTEVKILREKLVNAESTTEKGTTC